MLSLKCAHYKSLKYQYEENLTMGIASVISFFWLRPRFAGFHDKLTLVNSSFITEIARLGSEVE